MGTLTFATLFLGVISTKCTNVVTFVTHSFLLIVPMSNGTQMHVLFFATDTEMKRVSLCLPVTGTRCELFATFRDPGL